MNFDNGIMFLLSLLGAAVQLRVERKLSLGNGWNANEAGQFTKIISDYNETQMNLDHVCCFDCTWASEQNGETQMTLVEAADLDGETGSVSIAIRRLKRIRCYDTIWSWKNNLRSMGRKCDEAVAARTERAIDTLHRYGKVIRAEGEQEQQEIFETQMLRLGEHDTQIEELESERFTWVSQDIDVVLSSHKGFYGMKIRGRYARHDG